MKVLLVSHTYVATPYREKLAALSAQPDVDLTLIVPEYWQYEMRAVSFSPTNADRGYSIRPMPVYFNGRNGKFMFPWRSVVRTLKELAPDILHVEEEPLSLLAFQFLLLNRWTAKAGTVMFTWENLSFQHDPIRKFVERYTISHTDYLIAGNEAAKDLMLQKGAPEDRVSVFPQIGIHPPAPDDIYPFSAPAEPFTVGFVGRLIPEKGVFDLLEAFARLPKNAHLLVVGGGNAEEEFVRRAEHLGVLSRIELTGSIPHEAVEAHIRSLDTLVLPSRTTPRWAEQFGHVLIEAMVLGIPVVGSDSGAIPEVISDAGLVFPEGDVGTLTACLKQLLHALDTRAGIGRRGKARCLAHYTHDRIAEATCEIYRSILNN